MNQQNISGSDVESQAGLITELLKQFLQTHSRKEFLDECLRRIKNWAGVSGAGIRVLDSQSNIPYQAHYGFPAQFLEAETWLSTNDDNCTCVRVVRGESGPQDASQMTAGGSFCCNDTANYSAGLNEAEKGCFRGVCIVSGYSSLAVIPISYHRNIQGALHMVDERKNMFNDQKIKFLESTVAPIIGEGIYRYSVEDKLARNLKTQTVLANLLKYSLEDLTVEGVLNLALELIHSQPPFSQNNKSAILLYENEPPKMKLKVSRNFKPEEMALASANLEGETIWAKATAQQRLLYSALDTNGNEIRSGSAGAARHYGIPITFQKSPLGVIYLRLDGGFRREESEEQFLEAVANTLAGIIWRKRSEEMLRRLSLRLVKVQEEERRSMALELHDQIGQVLTGLKLMIGQAVRSNDEDRSRVLKEAQNAVTELIVSVRDMSLNLRPSMLDDLGLLPALIWHFQRCKTQSNLNIDFRHNGLELAISKDLAISAYRIVQEALTNVMRYAGVNEVLVEIWTDQEWLSIRVEDKGRGFDPRKISPGSSLGLQGMKERALLLGGNLTVDSVPNQGTLVFAQLPLKIGAENVTISEG